MSIAHPGLPAGTYVENSALEALLRDGSAFGAGPFVISEYSLAEKARLPWDAFMSFVHAAHDTGLRFLRAPPVTQLITGNLDSAWRGPIELADIDVQATLDGRGAAVRKLDEICDGLEKRFAWRYAELRPHYARWIELVADGNPGNLIDPRPLANRRQLVEALTAESLGTDDAPLPDAPADERLRWVLRAWETAMVFTRLERAKDPASDLRNDPIDAVHFALAATFCRLVATADRGIRRIRALMPSPTCPLLWVADTPDGVCVEHDP